MAGTDGPAIISLSEHPSSPSIFVPTNTAVTTPCQISAPPPWVSSSSYSSSDSSTSRSPAKSTPAPGPNHNAGKGMSETPPSHTPASPLKPSTLAENRTASYSSMPTVAPAGTPRMSASTTAVAIPLQTMFPTEMSSGSLHELASRTGDAATRDEESSGIMSALLAEDSKEMSNTFDNNERVTDVWLDTGGRHRNYDTVNGAHEHVTANGMNSRLDGFNDAGQGDLNMPTRNFLSPGEAESPFVTASRVNGKPEASGKPPLGPKKSPAKIVVTHSEPQLAKVAADVQHERETQPIPLSSSELFDLKVGKGSSQEGPAVLDGRLQATQSLPTWMPSVVTSSAIMEEPEAPPDNIQTAMLKTIPSDKKADETDETPPRDGAVSRTKSMPARDSPETAVYDEQKLPRSSTEKRRLKKNIDNANVRTVGQEKLSDRKKKKLMKRLATIQRDGVVEFDIGRSARLAKDLFGSDVMEDNDESLFATCERLSRERQAEEDEEGHEQQIPPLKIVMLIVGTRGDVQPFIAIGKKLQEYGHQVRLASHSNFRDFVKREGLEFYPLGGDPKILAEYMVKNKGFLPSGPSEISVQRNQIKSIVYSLLPACTEPDLDSGVPFRPHAIIANPPAYGHVHVAEYLKVPLHIYFTMPWTPTSAFPHPLSRVKSPAGYRLSYQIVDSLIWLGIRGIINGFRKNKLKLRPITYLSGSQGSITDMPTGYIWSPHLVPKPRDWGPSVDVVGFCFLNLATNYKPPEDLVKWLSAGPAPIYIGFGSLPVEDPEGMTKTIIDALQETGQRGIIGKGWGGIGNLDVVPENVFLLSDCPHDWLFPRCAAVVHHGGAGTTAAGLKAACPTTVVPFFGDQPFWGERVHEKGVGPVPIPGKHFTLEKLVSSINFMLDPAVKTAALDLAKGMEMEDGIQGAVNAFHKHIHKHLPTIMHEIPFKYKRRRRGGPVKKSIFVAKKSFLGGGGPIKSSIVVVKKSFLALIRKSVSS